MNTKAPADGVSQALAPGHCPLCALLLKFQNRLTEEENGEIVDLCNHHGWIVAKAAPAANAARIVIRLLNESNGLSDRKPVARCIFCESLQREEQVRLKEMAKELSPPNVRQWLKSEGTLCIPHARRLITMISPDLRTLIQEMLNRNQVELENDLLTLLNHLDEGDRTGWGVLGRAAEFLNAQRGLAE